MLENTTQFEPYVLLTKTDHFLKKGQCGSTFIVPDSDLVKMV